VIAQAADGERGFAHTWWTVIGSDRFETSSPYFTTCIRELKRLEKFDATVAAAPQEVALAMHEPSANSWWPSVVIIPFFEAVGAVGGAQLVRAMARAAVYNSISAIIRPFVAVLIAISGPSPATFFSRYPQLTQAGLKGVRFTWVSTGAKVGTLTLDYPCPVPKVFVEIWLAAFEYTFEVSKCAGEATRVQHLGQQLIFELAWQ